jgi:flagellar hook-basal body complex protein FliE
MMQPGIGALAAVAAAPAGMLTDTSSQIVSASGLSGPAQGVSAPDTFGNMLKGKLEDMDANVGAAEAALRDLAAGKAVEPHDVMITMERARISVFTFLQLRNKLVESYQDVMRMQL